MQESTPHSQPDRPSPPDPFLEASHHVQAMWRRIDALPWHRGDPEKREARQQISDISRELFTLLRELSSAYVLDEGAHWGGEPVRVGHIVEVDEGRARIIAMTPRHAVLATPEGVVVRPWEDVSTGEGAGPPQPDPREMITDIADKLRAVMSD